MRSNCMAPVIAVFVSLCLAVVVSAGPPEGSKVLPRPEAPSVPADIFATVVRAIDTSIFSPPSPDPAGITYFDSSVALLVSDSGVVETPYWAGANLFEINLAGSLIDTSLVPTYSYKPTGVAASPPDDGYLFFCTSYAKRLYVVDLGADGLYGTSDDDIGYFDTYAFGSLDPEGITFDTWEDVLFLADGMGSEVYRIGPGANGVFDGVPLLGDDEVTQFDTEVLGIVEPTGITFAPDSGTLYLVDKFWTDSLFQVTTSGTLIQVIDISVVEAIRPSGLAFAPSSQTPGAMNIYMTDSGIAPDDDPEENDGKIYEIRLSTVASRTYIPLVLRHVEP